MVESTNSIVRTLCFMSHAALPPSLSCFLQPVWFLVGGDRSFKLTLTEKGEEFSDELREGCEVRGEGRGGTPVSEVRGVRTGGEGRDPSQ